MQDYRKSSHARSLGRVSGYDCRWLLSIVTHAGLTQKSVHEVVGPPPARKGFSLIASGVVPGPSRGTKARPTTVASISVRRRPQRRRYLTDPLFAEFAESGV